MSTNTDSKPQSNIGFGGKLRSARTSRGYSIDDVADELNILKRHIQALEEEDFKSLPPLAYARGFIANYAKFLGLNDAEFVVAFEEVYPEEMKPKTFVSPLRPLDTITRGRSSVRINPWLIAGVIGIVVLAFVLLKIISNATSKVDEKDPTTDTKNLTLSEQAQGAAIGGAGSAIGINNTAVTSSENITSVAGVGVIDIWSKGDVSIKVVDKDDNVLMQGRQSQGGYQLKGATPLSVEIDNPAQVDMNFNQRPVRLGEHTKDGKATLTLQ